MAFADMPFCHYQKKCHRIKDLSKQLLREVTENSHGKHEYEWSAGKDYAVDLFLC